MVNAETESIAITEWNLGAGLGAFEYHLYPGAENTNSFVLPAPYFTYRSPLLEVDRGIKSFIYNSELIIIDISADFNLPVKSEETVARKGMPDLDFMLQLGPSIELPLNGNINGSSGGYFDIRFELPFRAAVVSDFTDIDTIGYVFEPRFSFTHHRKGTHGLDHKLVLGMRLATRDFHAYYYDVAPAFATPERPEYSSDGGFGGTILRYRASYRHDDFLYWIFARYQSLRGAEYELSPLVVQKDYALIGVGFTWIFASSYD